MAIVTSPKVTLYSVGTPVAISNQTMAVIGGSSGRLWDVGNEARAYLNYRFGGFIFEVSEDNGSTWIQIGDNEYELRYLAGRIYIDNYTSGSANVANITDVRMNTGEVFPRTAIGRARSIDHTPTRGHVEDDAIGDSAKRREYALLDFEASIERSEFDVAFGSSGNERTLYERLRLEEKFVLAIERSDITGNGGSEVALVEVSENTLAAEPGEMLADTLEFVGSTETAAQAQQTFQMWRIKYEI